MEDKEKRLYFKPGALIIALLAVGPLALPLVWCNSRFKARGKIIISLAVIILTYFLTLFFVDALKALKDSLGRLSAG